MKRFLWILGMGVALGSAVAQQQPKRNDGMWLPLNAEKLNAGDMKSFGLQMPVKSIYNEAETSLKDAIVKLDGGSCTAECISGQGLLLTNHHCAYDGIAALSTVEHDYLTDGFWAMSNAEEKVIPGATASFLIHSENVTERLTKQGVNKQQEIAKIVEEATNGKDYDAEVESMFNGGEYYLFVYETFRDVRLVGCPPSSIGKFGADTDNWMWPRHTGDFSLLRVYANKENKSAEYSTENQPYRPKTFLTVSLKGANEGDYAMVMGYPGSTERYLTASAVRFTADNTNIQRYNLMGIRAHIMEKAMKADNATRIALASDYASLMNYYKYMEGQNIMLKRYDVAGMKAKEEAEFQAWADKGNNEGYKTALKKLNDLYANRAISEKFNNYLYFGIFASSVVKNSAAFMALKQANEGGEVAVKKTVAALQAQSEAHFKQYFPAIEREVFSSLVTRFYEDIPKEFHPAIFEEILASKQAKKGKTTQEKFALWTDYAFANSIGGNKAVADKFFAKPDVKALEADPMYRLITAVVEVNKLKISKENQIFNRSSNELYRTYIQGLREMHEGKPFAPDANSTMRLTYGSVKNYEPKDGVLYKHYTTLDGVMEKEDSTSYEFSVPKKLKQLWKAKDYGRYGKNGEMYVNFLTTNDITGGNSGSPVLNAKGELIGAAFDGNWEAMAGDIYVFPSLNRTIVCDVRYILFIIDKFAGDTRLIDELRIAE